MPNRGTLPSVGFWAGVVLSLLTLYVLSFGPVAWHNSYQEVQWVRGQGQRGSIPFYQPLLWLASDRRTPWAPAILWYTSVGASGLSPGFSLPPEPLKAQVSNGKIQWYVGGAE